MCHPHKWQITPGKAKVIGIVAPVLGALLSIPHVILNGRQTKTTPPRNFIAYECATDDKYVRTDWQLINYVFFVLLFVTASVSLTALYARIGMKVWKHSRLHFVAGRMAATTSSRYFSKAMGPSYNENQSNSTRPGTNNNTNVLKSITGEPTGFVRDIKMNQVHVSDKGTDTLVKYGIPIFTDRIVIWTPMVGEFFVDEEQTTPGVAGILNHENSIYTTENGPTVQQGSDAVADARTWSIGLMEASTSDGVTGGVQSGLGNIDSNEKYNARFSSDRFLNTGRKTEAARTNNEINANVNTTFNSKECSEKTVLVYQYHNNVLHLRNCVDYRGRYQQSIQPAANKALNDFVPLSMFKWLGVFYCSEDEHTTCESNCVEREAGLSCRFELNNSLLQQTAWLRNSVNGATARQGDTTAGTSFERVSVHSSAVDPFNMPEADREGEIGPSNKSLSRIRLREMLETQNTSTKINVPQQYNSKRRSTARITFMLIFISVIYIVGFVPHLGLMIFKLLSPDATSKMSMTGRAVFNLFLRSYFLNSAANSIVYSLCDDNFRRDCFKSLKCR